ncbi:hypothetical protein Ddye_001516 [Dipteronia dyeriana]|uniref:Reverse transcriptase domain-containing protein n=1 Tax=Dipteronia dyeriana TaxID=168575 RepID=A0AAD9XPF3_9ROSI|nr:hypothetical protein Ddye_001516 [Dipteronia dyeriana]
MSKVYDWVEWNFLRCMMDRLGFSGVWIDRIMRCATLVSFSFIVNGEVRGNLKPPRGLCQGDPLSPYLFLIYVEGLSQLFLQAERRKNIAGFGYSKGGLKISHFFFADDSMSFTKASDRDCKAIKQILEFMLRPLMTSFCCVLFYGRIHRKPVLNDLEVIPWATIFFEAYKQTNCSSRVVLEIGARPGISWCLPMEDQLKMYTDAVVDVHSGRVGFGIIIHNHKGEVMASSTQVVSVGFSSQVAEAMAIFIGLVFAHDAGFLPCLVESDAQVVVKLIKADVTPFLEIGIVVHDIKFFLEGYCSCSVSFAPRHSNKAANCLAKFCLNYSVDHFLLKDFPFCVGVFVRGDVPVFGAS